MTQEVEPIGLLTPDDLLRRASAMVPVLKERAGYTEELRRMPDETVQDILASGVPYWCPDYFRGHRRRVRADVGDRVHVRRGLSIHFLVLLYLVSPRVARGLLAP